MSGFHIERQRDSGEIIWTYWVVRDDCSYPFTFSGPFSFKWTARRGLRRAEDGGTSWTVERVD